MEKYKCIDCDKEIKGVQFDEETKKRCPKSLDGFLIVICKDCVDNEEI